MRANTWAGRNKVEVRDVPDPKILNQRDAEKMFGHPVAGIFGYSHLPLKIESELTDEQVLFLSDKP
jgi:hypothetical protein